MDLRDDRRDVAPVGARAPRRIEGHHCGARRRDLRQLALARRDVRGEAGVLSLIHISLGLVLVACVGLAFAVMCAGSYVSSSGAGLACSTLPSCDGGSWLGTTGAQHAQMIHRLLAGLLFAAAASAVYLSAGAPVRVRAATWAGFALVVGQALLGFANVAWTLPTPLREAHAANACALYLVLLAALTFTAIDGAAPAAARVVPRRAAGIEPAR